MKQSLEFLVCNYLLFKPSCKNSTSLRNISICSTGSVANRRKIVEGSIIKGSQSSKTPKNMLSCVIVLEIDHSL